MSLSTRTCAAAIVVTSAITGTAGMALADDEPIRRVAQPQPPTSPYLDLEANKAASMCALGLHLAAQRGPNTSRYQDLQATRTRAQRALWKRAHAQPPR